jgi:DNA (cytosine-5)-methyltransferase 1
VKVVDLFAGFGGSSTGAAMAGARVVWAANHWPLAVQVHSENHPHAQHECQDLRQADWTTLPEYDVLIASPACQGHSPGSQPKRRPHHNADRATAWAVVDCAEVTRPRALIVENVPAFLRWDLYEHWHGALTTLGYRISVNVVTATRFDVPQLRERVLFVGTLRSRPPTIAGNLAASPAFGPCIDWNAPGWRPIANARSGAAQRIAAGQANIGKRCLVQHTTGHRGISLDEPIRTITTKDQWIIVDGDRYRPLTVREYARGMGFPESYRLPTDVSRENAIRGIGNAVCPGMMRAAIERVAEVA